MSKEYKTMLRITAFSIILLNTINLCIDDPLKLDDEKKLNKILIEQLNQSYKIIKSIENKNTLSANERLKQCALNDPNTCNLIKNIRSTLETSMSFENLRTISLQNEGRVILTKIVHLDKDKKANNEKKNHRGLDNFFLLIVTSKKILIYDFMNYKVKSSFEMDSQEDKNFVLANADFFNQGKSLIIY